MQRGRAQKNALKKLERLLRDYEAKAIAGPEDGAQPADVRAVDAMLKVARSGRSNAALSGTTLLPSVQTMAPAARTSSRRNLHVR